MSMDSRKMKRSSIKTILGIVLMVAFFGTAYVNAQSTSKVDQSYVTKMRENRSSMPLTKKPDLPPEFEANIEMEDPDELANQNIFHVSSKCDYTAVDDATAPLAKETHKELLHMQNDPFFN